MNKFSFPWPLMSAERTDPDNPSISPFFSQHQSVYNFCLQFVKNKSVIEIGCGSGYGTLKIAKIAKTVEGMDNDRQLVERIKKIYNNQKNLKFSADDAQSFSSKTPVDVIVSLQVIEHLENPTTYLEKISRCLKKNGVFILSTPNATTQSYNENPYHIKEFSSSELKHLLSQQFKSVKLYGLFGDKTVSSYQRLREKRVRGILSKDVLKLRRYIPRRAREILFDVASLYNRRKIESSGSIANSISTKNYYINATQTKNSIDLIAVCRT